MPDLLPTASTILNRRIRLRLLLLEQDGAATIIGVGVVAGGERGEYRADPAADVDVATTEPSGAARGACSGFYITVAVFVDGPLLVLRRGGWRVLVRHGEMMSGE